MHDLAQISNSIKAKSKELGLLECAIIPVGVLSSERENLDNWLKKEYHGEMGYMARNKEKRLDPRELYENAKTIILVLQNYYSDRVQTDDKAPVISKYAYGIDYHFVLKEKLNKLLDHIRNCLPECSGRPFVDSAPVLEKAWARNAGLGWIGKNSNLISPEHGSFFFIGELILDVELYYDKPKLIRDHCGNCTKCIDACPTGAIVSEKVVDARKCISYQTIELRGDMDIQLKGMFENRVFGCDICQDVCPWNLKSKTHNEANFRPKSMLMQLSSDEWHKMEKPLFNQLFKNSPVKRTGFKGLKRNLGFLK